MASKNSPGHGVNDEGTTSGDRNKAQKGDVLKKSLVSSSTPTSAFSSRELTQQYVCLLASSPKVFDLFS